MPEPLNTFLPDRSPAQPCAVFVYGTLRRGGSNDIHRFGPPAPRFRGAGCIAGVLHDLGPYPGVVLGGDGRVVGEVYEVAPEVERALDALEEVQDDDEGEYRRRHVSVALDEGRHVTCLVYEIHPRHVRGTPVIPSGDWIAHWQARQGRG
ncbi:gamma-glutamylcyclotransferase family protein [Pseudacidovorax sp. NFM-22]|uniref:gamma-glutamylcyclotransferase family protein n=1 Tax=Pseudacidovorax sp. NFM-22 TaxID=2744469 RepID=UPI001F39A17A|nr:gamma-glutamylcyclotransferase family protein [Pseudacidovorax sp. NFM-22]